MNRFTKLVLRGARRVRRKKPAFAPRMILFDFDGTVGDTFAAAFEILNRLAGEFGFRQLTESDLPLVRDMRTRQLLKFLEVPTSRLGKIARRGAEELKQHIDEIRPLPGLPEMIRSLHGQGFRLGIVTSNSEENVRAFLRNHDLDFFEVVRSCPKLMGKARAIRAVRKQAGFKRHQVLFIGDETRDIEACQKAGVRVVAVTWGYNSAAVLKSLRPDYLVTTPGEIEELLARHVPLVGPGDP
ncbi:MAG: HAD family hydrolase [Terrimicrobiaceae bacterium]